MLDAATKTSNQPTANDAVAQPKDDRGVADVRAFLSELLAQGRGDEALDQVVALLLEMVAQQDDLTHQNEALRKLIYGRRSEKVSLAQLHLFLQQAAQAGAVAPEEVTPPPEPEPDKPADKPTQRRPGRNPLPEHLPRKRVELKVAPDKRTCETCGLEKSPIGHECSEVLNFVPGHFEVTEYAREKLACKPCQEGVCIAAPAEKLVPGGMCGEGLLAQVLVSKYLDHCPLYRQHVIYLRSGVDLAESTLCSWVALGYQLLLPLARLIWQRAVQCGVIGADDTPIRVLDADHEKGVKRGHIWAYLGYDEAGKACYAALRYTEDWSKKGPANFLRGFAGTLQGDGYKGWSSIAKKDLPSITQSGCWAHSRRKGIEALDAGALAASMAVKLIQQLYAIEREAREQDLDVAARLALRQAKAVPVMAELRKWVDQHHGRARPTSPLGKAVGYLHNQWTSLQVYLADGRVPIDNNLVENQMRPVCLGKKNYLFCGSDAGGERAAVVYTALATCKLAGAEPWAYLNDVLPHLARHARLHPGDDAGAHDEKLAHLLPHAWVARRRAVLTGG